MHSRMAGPLSLSVIAVVILLVDSAAQGYAWRPQGRFGKRTGPDGKLQDMATPDNLRPYSRLRDNLVETDLPFFKAEDIVCVRKESGLYRCLRWIGDENADVRPTGL